MKLTIIAILYALGIVVYSIWTIIDEDNRKDLIKIAEDELPLVPNSLSCAIVVFVVCLLSIAWPYYTIKDTGQILKR